MEVNAKKHDHEEFKRLQMLVVNAIMPEPKTALIGQLYIHTLEINIFRLIYNYTN